MRKFCTFLLFFGLLMNMTAQNNFWKPIEENALSLPDGVERRIKPLHIQTFQLDYDGLTNALAKAPMEHSAAARSNPLQLSLPLADGSLHQFYVWESPIMAPELMAKYPGIRTYAGTDAEGLGLSVRLGLGEKGFHAFVFNQNGRFQSVRPYAEGTKTYYMSYRQEDLSKGTDIPGLRASCGVSDDVDTKVLPTPQGLISSDREDAELVTLKKYRLAISTQGEYAQFHGGTKTSVMSAIVEAVNFIVAIQERDWAIRLELIPNNDTLIYFDPATDPFNGALIPDWIGDNPLAINTRISSSSYDIGHLFAKVANPSGIYVAGQARLEGVCNPLDKAVAGSSLPAPVGEDYYLIIAHEMGHQFSATHTFNSCPPAQNAQTSGTAYEPGGGTTIMSYATTCDPDIVDDRDSYFHVASIEQVNYFTTVGGGRTCAQNVVTDNHFPEVSIPLTNGFYIPINTPFALKGNVTDVDGDNLTYCWEEYDLGPIVPLGEPFENSPIFRSFPPATSPERTFPRINSVVSNTQDKTEVLPTYNRELKFKLTARDNYPGAGGVAIAEVRFRSAITGGPFRVTYPNVNTVIWRVGEYQTVTWDVANTDANPIFCKKVNIRLSYDGGYTYPITLAENVANIGRACIQVPDHVTPLARVRVDAADNIFFDISNASFKIQQPVAATYSLCVNPLKDQICLPTPYVTEINTAAIGGFTGMVELTATGLPNGATAEFSPNPVAAGSNSTLTITMPANAPESTFDVRVRGAIGNDTTASVITLTTVGNNFSTVAPTSPAFGASGVNTQPLLQWSTSVDANNYEVELATNPSFAPNTIVTSKLDATTGSFQVTTALNEGGVYYWRVRPKNECGYGPWSEAQVFVVSKLSCTQLVATDLPKAISANGTPTVESKINLLSGGQISDITVTKVQGYHDYFKDLEVHLIGPTGTDVLLWKDRCSSFSGNYSISFDDGAGAAFTCPPPNNNAQSKPNGLLSNFNGQNATGDWILRMKDNAITSGGTLNGFELQICSNEATNPPTITVNNLLQLPSASHATIDASLLKAEDPNNTAPQLIYTLLSVPKNGLLQSNGWDMAIGGQFNQSDLDNGAVVFYDYGLNAGSDEFRFVVSDGEGGMATGIFHISPLVGTKELLSGLSFQLYPNPADELLGLTLGEPLTSDAMVALYNAAGQRIRSWNLPAGNTNLRMQVADLPQGVYAVSIENEAVKGVRKVVLR